MTKVNGLSGTNVDDLEETQIINITFPIISTKEGSLKTYITEE